MGAVVNMSPGTFHAAIAQVPFVDVMNTMLDDTLPLTTEEWIEWGNPNEKKAWDYMVQYSPYENVKAQPYPNMLIEISLNDSQVPYWEGAKLAAKIREMKTGDSVILLKTNLGAGHGGASGRYDRLKEIAFDYSYALTQVGIVK
jgi:oligopeptidase B